MTPDEYDRGIARLRGRTITAAIYDVLTTFDPDTATQIGLDT